MTLEQYAYLGEIFAAIGVVVSLIYVARQLGQNTAMMRVATASEAVERDFDMVAPMIQSPELADIWMKGERDFASLGPADQTRLIFFERRAIVLWHHRFQLHRQDLIPDASWREQTWIIQNIGRRQALRAAWRTFRDAYEPDFQEFMEGLFAIADRAGPA